MPKSYEILRREKDNLRRKIADSKELIARNRAKIAYCTQLMRELQPHLDAAKKHKEAEREAALDARHALKAGQSARRFPNRPQKIRPA